MTQWLVTYVASLLTFLVADAAWISLVARKLYTAEAGEVIRDKPQALAGVLFYLAYSIGITVLGVWPATHHFRGLHVTATVLRDVIAWGVALGLFGYSSFSFTNQAVIRHWKYKLAITDLLWGGFVTTLAVTAGFLAYRALA